MLNFSDPETFWLNFTNIGLGVVTLICFLVLARGVFQAIRARLHARVPGERDDHAFVLPDLGLTMADGGERIANGGKTSVPGNIFRSEN